MYQYKVEYLTPEGWREHTEAFNHKPDAIDAAVRLSMDQLSDEFEEGKSRIITEAAQ